MPITPPNPPDHYHLMCPQCGWEKNIQVQPSLLQKALRCLGKEQNPSRSLPDSISKECPRCGKFVEGSRVMVRY